MISCRPICLFAGVAQPDADHFVALRQRAQGAGPGEALAAADGAHRGLAGEPVRRQGIEGVFIAGDADRFVAACEQALELPHGRENGWLAEADLMLSTTSWDTTQARMAGLVAELLGTRKATASPALLVAAE